MMWLSRVLQLRENESQPVFLLMAFSFFMGWGLALYYITSTTVFLDHFSTEYLPLAYAVAGAAGYLAWWLLHQLDKHLPPGRQLLVKLIIVLASLLFFSVGQRYFVSDELAFFMFVWFRVLAFLGIVVFWNIAGRLFDLRQGKRIFGLISAGEVISDIIGFFSIPLFLQFMDYSDLLYLATASMLICMVIFAIIFRRYRDKIEPKQVSVKVNLPDENKSGGFLNYLKQPYFRQIFILAMLPIFGIMFIDFMFLDLTKVGFSSPEILAGFLSLFFGGVAVVEFILKTFVYSRLLSRFGLRVGLLTLPGSLLFSTTLATVAGLLFGSMTMFFSFIILSKLLDRAIRSAIYDPSFQILYQPLPADERMDFQNKIEGIPKAIGNTLAGLVLMGLTWLGIQSQMWYNLIFLGIVLIWVYYTVAIYQEYRVMIRKVMMGGNKGIGDKVRSFLRAGTVFFQNLLFSPIRKKVLNTLNLMEMVEPIDREKFYRDLLSHRNAKLRIEALNRMALHQLTSMIFEIDKLLADEKNEKVIEAGKAARAELQKIRSLTVPELKEMASSENCQDRLVVANVLGQSLKIKENDLFLPLLQDDDPQVRTSAILSAGRRKHSALWPYLFDNLAHPLFSNAAGSAIIRIGDPVLPELALLFGRKESDWEVQYKVIRLIGRIGGKKAIRILKHHINHPVDNVRHQVLLSLSNMGYMTRASEFPLVKRAIDKDIGNIVWAMASLVDLESYKEGEELRKALRNEIEEKVDRVFLLLSLLYDSLAMKKIRDIVRANDRHESVFAMEIIDMLVAESIKNYLIPLVDDTSYQEKVKALKHDFPQNALSLSERLRDIINQDFVTINKWTRACALQLIGQLKVEENLEILVAHFRHGDRLVRQTAQWSASQINAAALDEFSNRLDVYYHNQFERHWREIRWKGEMNPMNLVYDRVLLLKNLDLFAGFPEVFVADVAALSEYHELESGQQLAKHENSIEMYRVIHGTIVRKVGAKSSKQFEAGGLISEMDFGKAEWDASSFISESNAGVLRIPQEPIFEAVSNHLFLARSMAYYIDNK